MCVVDTVRPVASVQPGFQFTIARFDCSDTDIVLE